MINTRAKLYKSEVVDAIICGIEEELEATGRHLIKTETIFDRFRRRISLDDELSEREELLKDGARQLIQSRLYCSGYFSITKGFFVNIDQCENLTYLKMVIGNKDNAIAIKIRARNRIRELKGYDGQMRIVTEGEQILGIEETKTREGLIADLEADAI